MAKLVAGKRLHECGVCHAAGTWDDNWSWYGSVIDEEEGNLLKFCSPACMERAKKEGPRAFGYRPMKLRGYRAYRSKE